MAILQRIKTENELVLADGGYGRLYWQQGNIAQVREYLTRVRKIFERLGTLSEPDKVRQVLTEWPRASGVQYESVRVLV